MKKIKAVLIILFGFIFILLLKEKILCFKKEDSFVIYSNITYTASNMRDPFEDYLAPKIKPVKKDEKPKIMLPPLTVKGVIFEGPVRMAIINDKVVKVGEKMFVGAEKGEVVSIEILDIDKEGVKISYYGNEYKLAAPTYMYKPKK